MLGVQDSEDFIAGRIGVIQTHGGFRELLIAVIQTVQRRTSRSHDSQKIEGPITPGGSHNILNSTKFRFPTSQSRIARPYIY